MSKRLLIVTPVYPPYHGGIGYVAKQHAEGMREKGYEVEVVHLDNGKPLLRVGNAGRLRITKAVERADIVHVHYPFFGTAELLLKWKKRWPQKQFYVTYHMDPELSGWKGKFAAWYAKHKAPQIFDAADVVFVSTKEYAQAWSNRDWFLAHEEKVVEAPLGVDVGRFAPRTVSSQWKVEHEVDPELPIILFVGGMDVPHAFKGIPVLLNAFAQVTDPAQLVLVGDGELRPVYEKQTTDIEKRVAFVGTQSADVLPQWYAAADIVVLPSTTRGEAFGLVLLEAMASQVACIASELPGVAAVLDHGAAGVVVPPGDVEALTRQIQKLLRDRVAREEYALSGYERAHAQYQWEKMVDTYNLWYTHNN